MRPIYEASLEARPLHRKDKVYEHRARVFKAAVCSEGPNNLYRQLIVRATEGFSEKREKTEGDLTRMLEGVFREMAADLDRIEENRAKGQDETAMMARRSQASCVQVADNALEMCMELLRKSQKEPESGTV